jgi:hypothetical protein
MESDAGQLRDRPAKDAASSEEGSNQSWLEDWLEFVPSVLMALAVVLTAYSAYEATRWSGVQATDFATASSLRTQANSHTTLGTAQVAYDSSTFGEVLLSFRGEDLNDPAVREQALAYADTLMRDEFKPALNEWITRRSLNDPSTPSTPMELESYSNANLQEAEILTNQAEQSFLEAKQANQNGDSYILSTIFFASVLFFTGLRLKSITVRTMVLAFAVLCLVAGAIRLATLPFE